MRLRETTLSPLFRCFAAVTLLGWLVAQVLCAAHCSLGVGHGDGEHASCHGSPPTTSHHDDGESPTPAHDDSDATASCLVLKFVLPNGNALTLVHPEFHQLYTLLPFALTLDMTVTEPEASFSRQAQPRDWVFTPEVCLGPAFRSHAPPLLA
jgi:hypothetical protein